MLAHALEPDPGRVDGHQRRGLRSRDLPEPLLGRGQGHLAPVGAHVKFCKRRQGLRTALLQPGRVLQLLGAALKASLRNRLQQRKQVIRRKETTALIIPSPTVNSHTRSKSETRALAFKVTSLHAFHTFFDLYRERKMQTQSKRSQIYSVL